MPGVLNSNSQFGFSREVGKMANFTDPGLLDMDCGDAGGLEDIANRVLFDLMDSDNELPDNETPMDLLKYLENDTSTLGDLDCTLTCEGDCNDHTTETPDKYNKYRVSSLTDPFMGMSSMESSSPTTKCSLLSQMMSPLDYDFEQQMLAQKQETQSFVAWGHRSHPIKEEVDSDAFGDDDTEELTKSSISHLNNTTYQDDDEGIDTGLPISFMDTPSPSSQSGTATGDDSDVDIETVTETPRGIDSCGYFTQDSAPPSRAGSPASTLAGLQSSSLHSILTKSSGLDSPPSSTCSSASSSPRPSPTIHFNTYGVSSSASLAENLMKGRTSLLGQKRKLLKEKRSLHYHHHHHHHTLEQRITSTSRPYHNHVLCTSNSINFHDYAMSPLSPECPSPPHFSSSLSSTETGLPTVSSVKRQYKRKQLPLDASDKEKQHHHNQLERNRRQKLADLFVDLRDEVPKISCQSKASKVMILNEATTYIHELRELDENQESDIASELRRKENLTRQLRHLRAQLSSGRIG